MSNRRDFITLLGGAAVGRSRSPSNRSFDVKRILGEAKPQGEAS